MIIRLLKENILNGQKCTVIFAEKRVLNDPVITAIPGMSSLFKDLIAVVDKPFPSNIETELLVHCDLGDLHKVKKDKARLLAFTVTEINVIVILEAWRRNEKTYNVINSKEKLKKLLERVARIVERIKKEIAQSKQEAEKKKKKKPELLDIRPSEDGKSLLLSYDDNSKYVCPLNRLITGQEDRQKLWDKDFLSTLTIADNQVAWDDQEGGVQISIGEIKSKSQKLKEYLDFLAEAMNMSSYPKYEKLYEEYLRYYNEPCLKG